MAWGGQTPDAVSSEVTPMKSVRFRVVLCWVRRRASYNHVLDTRCHATTAERPARSHPRPGRRDQSSWAALTSSRRPRVAPRRLLQRAPTDVYTPAAAKADWARGETFVALRWLTHRRPSFGGKASS